MFLLLVVFGFLSCKCDSLSRTGGVAHGSSRSYVKMSAYTTPIRTFTITTDTKTLDGGTLTTSIFECKNVQASSQQILDVLLHSRKTWTVWISPGSLIKTDHEPLTSVGHRFSEYFGPGLSSSITWEVETLQKENQGGIRLVLGSCAHVGTFGWDRIVMSFDMNDGMGMNDADGTTPCTTWKFSYSWLVMNPWVSMVEKTFMRGGMIADNEKAFQRLIALCEKGRDE